MDELKPCAYTHVWKDFGHQAFLYQDGNSLWRVGCKCGYRGPVMATPEQAMRAHNELIEARNARPETSTDTEKCEHSAAGDDEAFEEYYQTQPTPDTHDGWYACWQAALSHERAALREAVEIINKCRRYVFSVFFKNYRKKENQDKNDSEDLLSSIDSFLTVHKQEKDTGDDR